MTQLAKTSVGGLVLPEQKYNEAEYKSVATNGTYLGRITLYGGTTNAVKKGLIPMAHFGLADSKEEIDDLGKTFDFLNIVWRPKAMDLSGDTITSVFDVEDPEFKRIAALVESDAKDTGCMVGPEYLIWLPIKHKFALYYMNNATARRAAGKLRTALGKAMTVKSKFIETTKYSWHGPEFFDCTTPFDLPDQDALNAEVAKFNNPPAFVKEEEAPDTGGRSR